MTEHYTGGDKIGTSTSHAAGGMESWKFNAQSQQNYGFGEYGTSEEYVKAMDNSRARVGIALVERVVGN